MSKSVVKYGVTWSPDFDPLQIEMQCIRYGGKWKAKNGQECGNGLSFHYHQMRKLIWPELDDEDNGQRWHKLCRDAHCENDLVVMAGPASSGKTHEAAWFYLCDWWCDPENTLTLVSSTDMRGLRNRVWGEICSLWEKGKKRFPYLGGYLIDSRVAITFRDVDGDEDEIAMRDMRQAIQGIPTMQGGKFVGISKFLGLKQKRVRLVADEAQCFVAGTLVQTPYGKSPIERLKIGDLVVNPYGFYRIKQTFIRTARSLVRVKFSDGESLVCTPEHPLLTMEGWVAAGQLNQSSVMVRNYEAMSIVQRGLSARQQQQGVSFVCRENEAAKVRDVRGNVSGNQHQLGCEVLFEILHREAHHAELGLSTKVLHQGKVGEDCRDAKTELYKQRSKRNESQKGRLGSDKEVHELHEPRTEAGLACENHPHPEAHRPQAQGPWRERNRADACGDAANAGIQGCNQQLPGQDRNAGWEWIPDILQSGSRVPEAEVRHRVRRKESCQQEAFGREEDRPIVGVRVDSVEVLEPGDFHKYGGGCDGVPVYNLEVAGHPSYSVAGIVAHNCMGASFLSSFSNLSKNGAFKSTILGNPTDIFDPLGKAAEPIDGWDGHLDPEKTATWRTKFMDGLCINLIGTDSPNFDFPPDKAPFKYLIDARKIALTLTMFTKDSWEYYSQCVGVFKIGTMARRVLTRRVCEEGKALSSDVIWAGERQRVCGVDAAYGGDRCVGGWAEFGKTIDGKMVLHIHPQVIIPISLKSPKEPEEQIAEHVRRECDANRIPPENMGHDSTGRGTLGTYLARVWSPMTNPIEFGGQPTDRPVTSDMFIRDPKTGVRRLKLCKEHYVKFVTELWFTVRYAVEAGQIRGLSEEAMEEFCQREWDRVSGDRIEIETKGDMKERIGRSPDLADHVAILVEMARRKGFTISKVINEKAQEASSTFMEELARNHRKMLEAKELQFTQ